jgi:single-stranded DNA-binding protein
MGKTQKDPKPHQDVNVYICTGRLTRNPKKRGETTTFGLAVDNVERMEGNPVEVPNFIDQVVTFGKEAEKCLKYLESGREVLIEAKLCINRRDLEIDGEVIYRKEGDEYPVQDTFVELRANRVQFLR